MLVVSKIEDVRLAISDAKRRNLRIGFVPTMGALHRGHLELVRTAKVECDFVVVSIFVNPTQFGPSEDFHRYPRPIEQDLEKCREQKVDLVFNPTVEEMYPDETLTSVSVSKITEKLCGAFRPGHFTGVTTVVSKLFNIVQPDAAYFGQKDAQQALVIRRMNHDLNFPIKLRVCPTVREDSGLALSSRNQYLSAAERIQAECLYQSLKKAKELIIGGENHSSVIISAIREIIESSGINKIDYISIIDTKTFDEPKIIKDDALVALAVRVGETRLIDNILLDSKGNELIITQADQF
jgi:pantoate--beta-alanine ligase